MEQRPAAAEAAAAAVMSSGEVPSVPDTPAIFQDPSALLVVFSKLEPRDLCALVQTCRTLQQLADTPWVWRSQAERKWAALAAPHLGGYPSHKCLLLDDCRRSAVLSLPLPQGAACSYVHQQPHYFFKCKLLQLQWSRGDNSLRLWFDARGEADLRRPLSSSLAVVQLQPSRQQQVAPASSSASGAAAGAGLEADTASPGAAAAAAAVPAAVALDWSRTLAVFSPDDCQLISDTAGHFKGSLVWHSSKCSSMLSLLLSNQQQTAQQQQQGAPPLEQHRHAQRARRSDAWEEWAGWELEQEQRQQQQAQHASAAAAAAAGDSTSSGAHSEGWLMGFLQGVASASGYYQQQRQRLLGSSSSGQAGPAAAAGAETAPAPQVALVFCYANDLSHYLDNNWTSFGLQPDYRPAVVVASPGTTAAATQQPNTGGVHVSSAIASRSTASASGAAIANASPTSGSASALPVTDLQLPVPLHHPQEGQWASAWLQLPAACVQQRGLLEQQLQAESEETEQARWSDLPEAVKRRGAAWWK